MKKAKDESIIDEKEKIKIDTFYVLMDTAVVSMEKCSEKNVGLSADISIFCPINFPEIKSNGIPNQSLSYISAKVIKFNSKATPSKIKEDLV